MNKMSSTKNYETTDRVSTYDPRGFIDGINDVRTKIEANEHIAIISNEKTFFAVPYSDTKNLSEKQWIDVLVPEGRSSLGRKANRVTLNEKQLIKILDGLNINSMQTIYFGDTGEKIAFITNDQRERILIRKNKERVRKIAADEGAEFISDPAIEDVEVPQPSKPVDVLPEPAAPAPKPPKELHPFSDMRSVGLPLFMQELLTVKNSVMDGNPISIVYDSKHFYAVSRQQAKGLKTRTVNGEEGGRVIISHGEAQKILKNMRDNAAEVISFKDGQIFIVNQATFDKIAEKALVASGVSMSLESEAPIEARKGPSDRQKKLMEMAGSMVNGAAREEKPSVSITYASEDAELGRIFLKQGGIDRYNDGVLGNKPAEALMLYRNKIVGILVSPERAAALGIPEADRALLSDKEIKWKTNFSKDYAGHNALREVSGLITERGHSMFYATLGYMHTHATLFEDVLEQDNLVEVNSAWLTAVQDLTSAYWAKVNPLSSGRVHNTHAAFVLGVNGVNGMTHDREFVHGKPVALMNRTLVKALAIPGRLEGEPLLGPSKSTTFGILWEQFKNNDNANAVLVLANASEKVSLVKPAFGSMMLPAVLRHSPTIEDMAEALTPIKDKIAVKPTIEPVAAVVTEPVSSEQVQSASEVPAGDVNEVETVSIKMEAKVAEDTQQSVAQEESLSEIQALISSYLQKVSSVSMSEIRNAPGQFAKDINNFEPVGKPGPAALMLGKAGGEMAGIVLPGHIEGQPTIGPFIVAPFGQGWKDFKNETSENAVLVLRGAKHKISIVKPNFGSELLPEVLKHLPTIEEMKNALQLKEEKPVVTAPIIPAEPAQAIQQPEQPPQIIPPVQQALNQAAKSAEGNSSILQRVAKVAVTLKDLKVDGGKLVEFMIDQNHVLGLGAERSAQFSDDATIQQFAETYESLKGANDPALEYELVDFDETASVPMKASILKKAFDDTAEGNKLVILRAGQQTIIVGNNAAFTDFVRDFV